MSMLSSRHRKTLAAIFDHPVRANIPWKDIEALFAHLGAEIGEGAGSRVTAVLNGVRAVFHRPHPQKETDKGAVKAVRLFLSQAGIKPEAEDAPSQGENVKEGSDDQAV